jgi:hypothetical protein
MEGDSKGRSGTALCGAPRIVNGRRWTRCFSQLFRGMAGVAGLEPATPGFGVRGSALTPRNFPQRMSQIIYLI